MKKREIKEEDVRDVLICEVCGSKFVYVLTNGQIICRRCGHRSSPKE